MSACGHGSHRRRGRRGRGDDRVAYFRSSGPARSAAPGLRGRAGTGARAFGLLAHRRPAAHRRRAARPLRRGGARSCALRRRSGGEQVRADRAGARGTPRSGDADRNTLHDLLLSPWGSSIPHWSRARPHASAGWPWMRRVDGLSAIPAGTAPEGWGGHHPCDAHGSCCGCVRCQEASPRPSGCAMSSRHRTRGSSAPSRSCTGCLLTP